MKPTPKSTKDLENFDNDCEALATHIEKHWITSLKPKGWDILRAHYKDFDGIQEWNDGPARKKAIKEFKSFDDSSVVSPCFVDKVCLYHTMYDDVGQGRNPLRVLIGATMTHGHIRGELYGKEKERQDIIEHLGWVMSKILYGKIDEELYLKFFRFIQQMKEGKHRWNCKCPICRIDTHPLTTNEREVVKAKIKKILKNKYRKQRTKHV